MVELKQLRKFVVVVELRNFTRAAESLHIAQPALSRQIARLEEQLGAQLIDRRARPFMLTDAGRRFYEDALAVLDRVERMQATARKLGAGRKRTLTIAFSPTIVYGGISHVMKHLAEALPDVDIRWREMMSGDQDDALRKGVIDIGFSRSRYLEPDIVQIPMRDERLFVAIPPDDVLALSEGSIGIADLDDREVIVYPSGHKAGFADQTIAWLRASASRPSEIREVSEIDTALAFVAAGLGFCLVPANSRHLRSDIAYRLIEDANVTIPVLMCHRAQEDRGLIESVKAVVRKFADDDPASLDAKHNRFHDF
ncbi:MULTISPECIES: LysR family transcriptional regulator [Gammaproteobacteria]|uniref:LysR family transcriptional regulator n=1 Tax=Gammaproteobacteria TaxID=1236 RepID=UPI00112B012C|nr:LysR family transcriptional regulator [Pseudomonas sp. Hp2]